MTAAPFSIAAMPHAAEFERLPSSIRR